MRVRSASRRERTDQVLLSDGFREWLEEAPDGLFGPVLGMIVGGLVLLFVGLRKWETAEHRSAKVLTITGAGVLVLASARVLVGL